MVNEDYQKKKKTVIVNNTSIIFREGRAGVFDN